ncbi:MAG: AlwI family type II restriction endonuclease [Bacteroidales bacterium]
MAKIDRTKELWHIPKRGNVHQTVFMVNMLALDKFLNKTWSSGKQESMASEMVKAGLTSTGKLSHQSVRTLLANLPKYLGFVFIDESSTPSKIIVTDVGYELIKNHPLDKIPKLKTLSAYEKAKKLIETSEVIQKQMSKLIITNPIIKNDCDNILVFPFRITLKLLLKLEYLDIEELAYIVFHTKSEDEFPVILERIKNFRSLSAAKRTSEINAYRKTPEGNLTLVKAPSAGYYMYLCFSTGLCSRTTVIVNKEKSNKLSAIKLIDKIITKKILKQFEDAEIYNFESNWFLWKEYFSNPRRLFPPFNATVKLNTKENFLITIEQKEQLLSSGLISGKTFSFPVFRNESYKITLFDLISSQIAFTSIINFSEKNRIKLINLKTDNKTKPNSLNSICYKILDFFSNKNDGFDKDYSFKLKTLQKVIGKNYFQNIFKGGRLEALFNELLSLAKESKKIDEIFWFGKEDNTEYGIAKPAPGGKNGNPDIVFEIDNYQFVLELTTFRGNRAQWNSSEASSVPDHIAKFKNENPKKKTIGIFSAPSIHEQLRKNLSLNAKEEKVGMIFINCFDLANLFLKTRKEILNEFVSLTKTQML